MRPNQYATGGTVVLKGAVPVGIRAGYPIAILTKRGHLSWDLLIPASTDIKYRLRDKAHYEYEVRRFDKGRGKWVAIASLGPIDEFPRLPRNER
jgi:hypothetical protein